MTKNIIFPVNNKGGVGKTSVLADLSAVLAQRYTLGIIDADYQASLAKTLLGRTDLGWKPLDFYQSLGVQDVTLINEGGFTFSSSLSTMKLDVEATRARLAVFPVGSTYREPEMSKDLDRILTEDLGDASIFAVDLPPISDPYLILDHSIGQMVDAFEGDVRLFPLIVSTPDHRVFEDGLEEFAVVQDYFAERGVSPDNVHPFAILNKVPLEVIDRGDGKMVTSAIDPDTSAKFAELGVLYVSPNWDRSALNHVNRKFDHNGTRFRVVTIPYVDTVEDGRFALFMEEFPRISLYPHLAEMIEAHDYGKAVFSMKAREGMYARALWDVANHVFAHSGVRPRKNYTKRRTVFDEKALTSDAVEQFRRVLGNYYSGEGVEYTELVTKTAGCSSADELFMLPKKMTVEQMAELLVATQGQLSSRAQLNYDEVLETLQGEDMGEYHREQGVRIGFDGGGLFEIEYCHMDANRFMVSVPRLGGWDWERNELEPGEYLAKMDVFLRNLNRVME